MRRKVLSVLLSLAMVFTLIPMTLGVAFADPEPDNISITLTSDSTPATEGTHYTYDSSNKKYTILSGSLTVSGYTANDNFVIASTYSAQLTLKDLTIDLSATNKTAIESLADYTTIDIKGNVSITAGISDSYSGTYYEQAVAGIKGKSITLTGDGNLYIYGGHQSYNDVAVYVENGFMSRVNLLYMNAYNGIRYAVEYDTEDSFSGYFSLATGNIYIMADDTGIYGHPGCTDITIGEGVSSVNVNIYSGKYGLEARALTVRDQAQLVIETEDSNGMGYSILLFKYDESTEGGTLTLEDGASMYITHCDSGSRDLYCSCDIILPDGAKLKAFKGALAGIDMCTEIEKEDLYYTEYSTPVYDSTYKYQTIVFGNPTLPQSVPVNFKTEILSAGSVKISGLTAPSVPEGLPAAGWYYATDLEYNDYGGSDLSCLDPANCYSGESDYACRFHRMAHIAEGYASLMPNLQPLEVSGGEAVINGLSSPYFAVIYAGKDSFKRPDSGTSGTGDTVNLAYGIGFAEISDWTVGTENDSANILVPDAYGKVGDIFPALWCGEWELDKIITHYYDSEDESTYSYGTYYIGSEYNGTKRTKGDLIFTLNTDRSYTLSGLENGSDISKYVSDPEIGSGYMIEIGGKNYRIEYSDDGYDRLEIYRSICIQDPLTWETLFEDSATYTFVRTDVERVNLNCGENTISLIKGRDIYLSEEIPVPERTGYVFGGWFMDSDCLIPAPEEIEEIEDDIIIYPKWFKESTDTYFESISGTIKINDAAAEDVWLDLCNGDISIAEALTNADGSFTFELPYTIAPGFYQLHVSPDEIEASTSYLLELNSDSAGIININIQERVYGTVGKYDETLFYPLAIGNFDLLTEAAVPAGTNLIDVEAYYGASNIEAIAKAGMKDITGETDYFDYFDFQISRSELDEDYNPVAGGPVYDTDPTVMVLALTYPTRDRKDIQVLRYHDGDGDMIMNGTVSAFTRLSERPASGYQDGTYYVGDNYILIYSSKFSTFGIASNAGEDSPTPAPQIIPSYFSYDPVQYKEVLEEATKLQAEIDKKKAEEAKEEKPEVTEEITAEEAKALAEAMVPTVRTENTARGIKVYVKDSEDVAKLKAAGYKVLYDFYRAEQKAVPEASDYKITKVVNKEEPWYLNTAAKKGQKYYYKAIAKVYDADGNLVAETELTQGKYGTRTRK